MNGEYIRAMDLKAISALAKPFAEKDADLLAEIQKHPAEWFEQAFGVVRGRLETLEDREEYEDLL